MLVPEDKVHVDNVVVDDDDGGNDSDEVVDDVW